MLQPQFYFDPSSSVVSGTGLWKLSIYGSKNAEGTGDHIQHVEQALTTTQQSQPLISGANIGFINVYTEMDLTELGCGEYRFLCFDFTKGDNPSPDFTFTSQQQGNSQKYTVCKDRPCIGL